MFSREMKSQIYFSGISTTEGGTWEIQRNFLHNHILDLVIGKKSQGFHDIIMDEVQDMKMELSKKVCTNVHNNNKI